MADGAWITAVQIGDRIYELGKPVRVPSGGVVNVEAGPPPRIKVTTCEVAPGCQVTVSMGPPAEVLAERERCAKIVKDEPIKEIHCVGRDLLTVQDTAATKTAILAKIRGGK